MTEQAVFTVTALNDHIKALVESDPMLASVAVRGELSNYKVYPSGHHYFTLKDAESSLRCVMFKLSASRLRFRPENGMGVTVFGRVSVYPRDGAYQLYCTAILPEGMGDLHVAFEQLKRKLAEEGLFDSSHKKPIPRYPRRIAVITSGAGAAVRDVIRVLGKRWPLAEVIVMPVRVQGVEAPPEIVGAIEYANRWHVADLIITGRGGGSMEDLWAFNDERVARAIYASEIPVISAVGHEPDVTIADYVADLRAATPSNGAELAVPDRAEIGENLAGTAVRMQQSMRRKLQLMRSRLDDLSSRRMLRDPMSAVEDKRMQMDLMQSRLAARAEGYVHARRSAYVRLAASLDALSPLKVLSRGYSVVQTTDGTLVKDAAQIGAGDKVCVELMRGRLKCVVEEKEEAEWI